MQSRVHTLSDPEAIHCLSNPARLQVLQSLQEPETAANVARQIGQTRQKVNYHLQELVRVGLAEHCGERRKGNFMEQLYRAVSRRFVISPKFAWDPERVATTIASQASLNHLGQVGERLQVVAASLMDRAAYDGEHITTATVEAEVAFASAKDREAFMNEYLAAVAPLLRKYARPGGEKYQLAITLYPDLPDNDGENP